MKVVQINAYDFGSTGKIMLGIAEVSRNQGIDAYTFSSSRGSKGAKAGHYCFDRAIDYKIHMGMGMFFGFETDFSYLATKRLIKRLEEIKPDIIHLHNTHGWYLNHPLLFKYIKKNNIKIIWTLHDCWTFTGRCPYFTITGCDRWKTGCKSCVYDKKMYPASFWFDTTRRQYKNKKAMFCGISDMTIVTPSCWLSELVKESYLGDYDTRVINNGINLNLFRPYESNFKNRHGIEDKKVILGISMNWGERKGFDTMLELAKRLDSSYSMVLVGTLPKDAGELPPNIIHIERTANQEELAKIYSIADVFANPTREDNFPTVNIEALACGTPVVTFKTGGSPESLDSTCGSIVDYNDTDAFVEEVKRVCDEKPYSFEDCRKRAECFDMNDKFLEYVDLYQKSSN